MNQNTETKLDIKEEGVKSVTKNSLCCDVCGKPFKGKNYLSRHKKRYHGLKCKIQGPTTRGDNKRVQN